MSFDNMTRDQIIYALQQHVCLVSMTLSYPRLSRQITGAKIAIEGDDSMNIDVPEELRTVPQWKLLPPAWAKELRQFDSTTRKVLRAHSHALHALRGTALLPVSRAEEVFNALRERRELLNTLADSFVDMWPAHVDHLRSMLDPTVFNRVISKLPTTDRLRAQFNLSWYVIPLSAQGGGVVPTKVVEWADRIEELATTLVHPVANVTTGYEFTSEELNDLATAMRTAARKPQAQPAVNTLGTDTLIGEAREQLSTYIAEQVKELAAEPQRRLATALDNLAQACNTQGRHVRQGTMRQVQEAWEYLQGFSFLADDALLRRMEETAALLANTDHRDLNQSPILSRQISEAVTGAADMCRQAARQQTGVRKFAALQATKLD